jgi:hypothetical protein
MAFLPLSGTNTAPRALVRGFQIWDIFTKFGKQCQQGNEP